MKKKKEKEELMEEKDACECESDECDCGEEAEEECAHDCNSCPGCSGELDDKMIISLLEAKNAETTDKFLRLQADFLNFKTRSQSEMARMLKYEGEEFIKELLVIKDNLERAVVLDDSDLSDEVSKFLSGIKLILGNLTALFDKYEIKEIDCLGKEFDPTVAEAVITEQIEEKPENVVLEVYTKGYMYKDKLIRPAMVKVNK